MQGKCLKSPIFLRIFSLLNVESFAPSCTRPNAAGKSYHAGASKSSDAAGSFSTPGHLPAVSKNQESKESIANRKKAAKWFKFGSQPMPVRKREGIPDAAIDDFNKICKELAELSAVEKISIHAGKSQSTRKSRFNPYAFVEQALNKNRHPEAILESIQWLVTSWDKFDDPWAYGQKVLVRQSGNFYEAIESKAHDERMKALNRHFHPEIHEKEYNDPDALGNVLENFAARGNA